MQYTLSKSKIKHFGKVTLDVASQNGRLPKVFMMISVFNLRAFEKYKQISFSDMMYLTSPVVEDPEVGKMMLSKFINCQLC